MPQISEPALATALRKRFEIAGEGVIETLSPEIVPVIVVEDIVRRFPPQVQCAGFAVQTAVAGEYTVLAFQNPTGSGVIAELSQIYCYNTGAGVEANVQEDAAGVSTACETAYADQRIAGSPSCTIVKGTLVAPGGTSVKRISANGIVTPVNDILAPGDTLRITALAVAQELHATFWWQERPLVAAEG